VSLRTACPGPRLSEGPSWRSMCTRCVALSPGFHMPLQLLPCVPSPRMCDENVAPALGRSGPLRLAWGRGRRTGESKAEGTGGGHCICKEQMIIVFEEETWILLLYLGTSCTFTKLSNRLISHSVPQMPTPSCVPGSCILWHDLLASHSPVA
jgi:hypothetical protein